jgi:hypothetical protein
MRGFRLIISGFRRSSEYPEQIEEVYLQAARIGVALGDCGLSSLVRFGKQDHCAYATFILSEEYVRQSDLKIIGYKGERAVYSLGWSLADK